MSSILDTIAKKREEDVREAMTALSLDGVVELAQQWVKDHGQPLNLHSYMHTLSLSHPEVKRLAAEFKRASPSKGPIAGITST